MSVVAGLAAFVLFLLFQAQGIQTGDSGDLVTAAYTFGVPHPPGYPLYTFFGWIISRIPLFTVAWRVALISSIAHATVVALVYRLVTLLTRKHSSGFFAALVLGGNYLFFLYSTTPEVFALLDLFLVLCLTLVQTYLSSGSRKWLYLLAFVFGLALSHHHMILFLLPAIGIALFAGSNTFSLKQFGLRQSVLLLVFFIVGLTPYLYVPIAARGPSIINWDRATTPDAFVRLLTRADYGTFQSGAVIGQHPVERLLQLKVLGHYTLVDFSVVGLGFFVTGLWYLRRIRRRTAVLLVSALVCMGPIFFYYASFPVANRFTLATYERFLLPTYVLLSIFMGSGHAYVVTVFTGLLRRITPHVSIRFLSTGVMLVSFLYPLLILSMTLWRFWAMPQDRTADNFGRDIFARVPQGSLLALGRDTTLFTGQYMRYGQLFRPDTYLIHGSFAGDTAYQQTMKSVFPDLIYPVASGSAFLSEFLIQNAAARAVFSNIPYPVADGWFWIPHGLLYRLTANADLPAVTELKKNNERIWSQLHDPTVGILSRYKHLMLSDVLDVYAGARIQLGKIFLSSGYLEEANVYFSEAVRLGGDTQLPDAYMYTGITELLLEHCDEALAAFTLARGSALHKEDNLDLYEGITYRDCVGDPARAQQFFSEFEARKQQKEIPLEQW